MNHLPSPIAEQLTARGEQLALVCGQRNFTYAELDCASDNLAHSIASRIEGDCAFLPILGPRSAEFVVALLACWKLGLTPIPLGSNVPPRRLAAIQEEIGSRYVLCHPGQSKPDDSIFCLDWRISTEASEHSPLPFDRQNPAAYVIYTSGTTGKPKGCLVGFESLLPITEAFVSYYGLSAESRMTFAANTAFDAAMMECLPALLSGATLYVLDQSSLLNTEQLLEFYRDKQITFSWLPTAVAEVLMADDTVNLPRSLEILQVAGQRLSKRPPASWRVRVENAYGPTETTVIATSGRVPSAGSELPDIGIPLPGVELKILDENGESVPEGETGELHIGGIGVSRGYLHTPESPKDPFLSLPCENGGMQPFYATGDICRQDNNGRIHFIDRQDDQVKINGHRIELGEITYCLNAMENVIQSYVDCHSVGKQKFIVAYLVLAVDTDVNLLTRELAQRLPDYMLPASYVKLDQLPLTENGKVDAQRLPPPDFISSDDTSTTSKELADDVQAFLSIFQEQVGDHLSWHSDFFCAGGNSVAAITITSQLYRQLGLTVSHEQVTKLRTPAKIFAAVNEGCAAPVQILPRNTSQCALPLSASQRSVWFLANLDSSDRAYHAKATVEMTGDLNEHAMKQALQVVLDRHEIFRTSFHAGAGDGEQIVHHGLVASVPTYDYSYLTCAEAEQQLDELVQHSLNKPFSLAEAPLVRWALVKLPEQRHVLVHIEHHLVHDGWSYNLFLRDLVAAYRHFTLDLPLSLPEPGQYADFCIQQQSWLTSAEADQQRGYWQETLAGTADKQLNLPSQVNQDAERRDGNTLRIHLDRGRWQQIEQLAESRGETAFSLVLAAFNLVLHRYSGDRDISVGSAFANRSWVNADQVVGMMINTVVLRTRIGSDETLDSLMANCFATVSGAQANQELPFEQVVNAINPDRLAGTNPLFQVFMGFHDSVMPSTDMPGIDHLEVFEAIGSKAAKFDLSMVVIPRKGQRGKNDPVHLLWEYKTGKFSDWFVRQLADSFLSVVEHMVKVQSTLVADMLRIAAQLSGPAQAVPSTSMVSRLLTTADQNLDSIAIRCGAQTMTYGELAHKVRAKCSVLQQAGIAPGQYVGVLLPRGTSLIVWLLAVQACGATYIPLDPSYPEGRISFIIEHSRMDALVTDQGSGLHHHTISANAQGQAEYSINCDKAPQSPMYVIYTSGSTGQPKGVMISHHAFNNFVESMDVTIPLTPEHSWLSVTSCSFDISTLEFYLPLLKGATLVLAQSNETADSAKLIQLLAQHHVTHMQATPATWRSLLEAKWHPTQPMIALCGGEALDAPLAKDLRLSGVTLFNMYGPTETTVWSSVAQINDDSKGQIPLGRPIHNTQLHLLDEHNKPVPPGAIGHLWISGDGLADGYLHNPVLTDQRFQTLSSIGKLAYHTGDLVSLGEDNKLLFHGRCDFQVKLNGYRIELGEIEQVLKKHPAVQDASVNLRTVGQNQQLVAYVVATGVQSEELRSVCANVLPAYMIPSHICFLTNLPLTPNGKVDRHRLPDIEVAKRINREAKTETEQAIAELLAEHLGLDRVDVTASFYQLGGQSLMAMRLSQTLSTRFGIVLSTSEFLSLSSVENLAAFVDAINPAESQDFSQELTI